MRVCSSVMGARVARRACIQFSTLDNVQHGRLRRVSNRSRIPHSGRWGRGDARGQGFIELSYSKVRALTRVATPETEERLLKVGRAGTAEHVERIVRGWRRVDRIVEARESTRRHRSRTLHVYQDEDGMVVVRGRLEPEAGAVLMKALEAGREALHQRRRDVPAEKPPDGLA